MRELTEGGVAVAGSLASARAITASRLAGTSGRFIDGAGAGWVAIATVIAPAVSPGKAGSPVSSS